MGKALANILYLSLSLKLVSPTKLLCYAVSPLHWILFWSFSKRKINQDVAKTLLFISKGSSKIQILPRSSQEVALSKTYI